MLRISHFLFMITSSRHPTLSSLCPSQYSSGGWLLASASSDRSVCIWDIRAIDFTRPPLQRIHHPQSVQSAEWAPSSPHLLTTCMDDFLRIYDSPSTTIQARTIAHCTQTGRWVLPFRALWTADGQRVVCGGMTRSADVYTVATGELAISLSSGLMTSIPSRNAVHARGLAVACATGSGSLHLYYNCQS